MTETTSSCKCAKPNPKVISKVPISVEEEPGAYCGVLTHTTFEMTYQCKDCGQQWKETKVETTFG
ncbi:MAG TPA: hypothetical protein PLG17_05255 [Thermodesulfobacteriota bacterium]|nr:hypothetical protein [Deltaproteobacteria bacterium]HNR12103.1 hypothetical protein [Thermodesulfobacteriota bacterium]HNU70691.1 hypothetical protein [Thermodesulfobacteriota bacterium]HQO77902.1 hypothetical protein [Thermodesulfobacteriota bacterium]